MCVCVCTVVTVKKRVLENVFDRVFPYTNGRSTLIRCAIHTHIPNRTRHDDHYTLIVRESEDCSQHVCVVSPPTPRVEINFVVFPWTFPTTGSEKIIILLQRAEKGLRLNVIPVFAQILYFAGGPRFDSAFANID